MSTRANIIIKDLYTKLYFYRHSDGYPECTGESLKEFCKGYTSGKLRDNASQSAGHLIIQGNREYSESGLLNSDCMSWKVGAYEPTDGLHSDVNFVYIIDTEKRTIETRTPKDGFWQRPTLKNTVRVSIEAFQADLKLIQGGVK